MSIIARYFIRYWNHAWRWVLIPEELKPRSANFQMSLHYCLQFPTLHTFIILHTFFAVSLRADVKADTTPSFSYCTRSGLLFSLYCYGWVTIGWLIDWLIDWRSLNFQYFQKYSNVLTARSHRHTSRTFVRCVNGALGSVTVAKVNSIDQRQNGRTSSLLSMTFG